MLCREYGYSPEYVLSRSPQWRTAAMEMLVRLDAGEKRWDLTIASLSHTPMSKEAARESQRAFTQVDREIDKRLRHIELRKMRGKPIKSEYTVVLEPGDDPRSVM